MHEHDLSQETEPPRAIGTDEASACEESPSCWASFVVPAKLNRFCFSTYWSSPKHVKYNKSKTFLSDLAQRELHVALTKISHFLSSLARNDESLVDVIVYLR